MTRDELKTAIRLLEGLTDKRLAYGKLWDEKLGCGCVQGMLCPREAWPSMSNTLTWEDEDSMQGFIPLVLRTSMVFGVVPKNDATPYVTLVELREGLKTLLRVRLKDADNRLKALETNLRELEANIKLTRQTLPDPETQAKIEAACAEEGA